MAPMIVEIMSWVDFSWTFEVSTIKLFDSKA